MHIKQWSAFLVMVGICATIIANVLSWLIAFQKQLFGTADTLLFVHSERFICAVIVGILAIGLCVLFWLVDRRPYLKIANQKISYVVLIAGILAVSATIEATDLFRYSRVTLEGIDVRQGVWEKEKHYAWGQVRRIDLGYWLALKINIQLTT